MTAACIQPGIEALEVSQNCTAQSVAATRNSGNSGKHALECGRGDFQNVHIAC